MGEKKSLLFVCTKQLWVVVMYTVQFDKLTKTYQNDFGMTAEDVCIAKRKKKTLRGVWMGIIKILSIVRLLSILLIDPLFHWYSY